MSESATQLVSLDLSKFCASDLDPRKHLQKPWRVGDWVFATNGHFAVRVPAADFPDVPTTDAKVPDLSGMFARYLDSRECEWQPVPDVGPLDKCRACGGAGKLWARECDACEGGEFDHHGYTYDCKSCEGSAAGPGWIDCAADARGAVQKTCECCDGIGYAARENGYTKVGRAHYAVIYLSMFGALPGAEICPGDPVRESYDNPREVSAVFRFEGGAALLAPARP